MWGKIAIVVVGVLLAISLFNVFQNAPSQTLAFTDFINEVGKGSVTSVTLRGQSVRGLTVSGLTIETRSPFAPDQTARYIYDNSRSVRITSEEEPLSITNILLSWVPMLFLIGFWVWLGLSVTRALNRLTQAVEKLGPRTE